MFINGKFFLFAIVICLDVLRVKGIILKKAEHETEGQSQDNEIGQSVDRGYIAEFEHNNYRGREGLGLHDYTDKHFEGDLEGYRDFQSDKYHQQFGHSSDGHYLHHHHYYHKHKDIEYHKALAIKSLLVPLAGVALLGAAAAFISNPILLQLGVISGVPLGRRKRDVDKQSNISNEINIRSNEIKLLEKFMAKVPKNKFRAQKRKWLADYLSCTGINKSKLCIERLTCELYSPVGYSMPMEAEILKIVVNEILNNEFVPKGTKIEILQAIETGKNNLTCDMFYCAELKK